MTFLALTPEQKLLQESTAAYIDARLPVAKVRELVDEGRSVDREYLLEAAELGWYAALVPDDFGGGSVSDLGIADLAIVAEQRGRNLQPGPFTGTNVVASAVARGGSEELKATLLPLLAQGQAHGAWVSNDLRAGTSEIGLPATPTNEGIAIDGVVARVQDAQAADWLLVAVTSGGELREVVVPKSSPGIEIAELQTFDLTTQMSDVRFVDVRIAQESVIAGAEGAADDLALAALLTLADSVGAMSRLIEMTLDYARQREAFGKPIGAFQAVKHQIADASMYVHASKAVAGAATEALATHHPDRLEVVSIAKSFVGDSSFLVAQTCLQLHGGIGYAWEHDLHLYLRRLASNSALFGDSAWHRAAITRTHGLR